MLLTGTVDGKGSEYDAWTLDSRLKLLLLLRYSRLWFSRLQLTIICFIRRRATYTDSPLQC